MKTIKTKPGRFAPGTRFKAPDVSFRVAQEADLEQLKQRLLRQLLGENTSPDLTAPLRRAANEAAALAWPTPCALLVFPTLLEEKAQAARHQTLRQAGIRRRSRNLLAED